MTQIMDDDNRAGMPSASGADKLFNCPGSVQAEKNQADLCPVVTGEENEIAAQGTRIHAALEKDKADDLSAEEARIFTKLTEFGFRVLRDWLGDNQLDRSHCSAGREERLWIRNRKTKKPIGSAKLDRCYVCGEHGLALDFKTGFLDASPSYINAQLRLQALALWHEYPEVTKIRVAIAQVRFKGRSDFCDYSLDDLREAEAELLHALWRAAQADAPRYPGSWCRYCRANGNCREAAAYALLPVVYQQSTPDILEIVAGLTPIDLARIHARKAIAEVVFKAVDSRLKAMDTATLASLGLCLKPNSPTREVVDAEKLHAILQRHELVTTDEFLKLCKVPIGETEKLILPRLAKGSHLKVGEAKEALAQLIASTIKFNERSPSIKTL